MTAIDSASRLLAQTAGLLVDLDGTLVDSSGPVERAWTDFAARHGLDPAKVLRRAHGRPSRETVRVFAPPADHAEEERRLEAAECADTEGTRPLPGAQRLLSSPGHPIALVTSCSARLAAVRLRAAGLEAPAIAVTADDVSRGKPDPECFLLGARALGLDPADCLALEDSPAGVAAARTAGARVIALRTTHSDPELGEADVIVDDLGVLWAG